MSDMVDGSWDYPDTLKLHGGDSGFPLLRQQLEPERTRQTEEKLNDIEWLKKKYIGSLEREARRIKFLDREFTVLKKRIMDLEEKVG